MDPDYLDKKLDEHYKKIKNMNELLYLNIESLFNIYNLFSIRHSLPSMRRWAILPDFAMIIINEIFRKKPKMVVELGSGVSTLLISYALEKQQCGKLISLEHDEFDYNHTNTQIMNHSLQDYVELNLCPLTSYELDGKDWQWYDISKLSLESIDMLIVDGPPANIHTLARYPALPLLDQYMSPHSLVLCDDANRAGDQDVLLLWKDQFPQYGFQLVYCEKGGVILHRD